MLSPAACYLPHISDAEGSPVGEVVLHPFAPLPPEEAGMVACCHRLEFRHSPGALGCPFLLSELLPSAFSL